MKRRSIAQEYYTLMVDQNGYMPPMHREDSAAGLVAAAFMDLLLNHVITADLNKKFGKKITVESSLPEELDHIGPLYRYLSKKERTVDKMMADNYEGPRQKELVDMIGKSLCEENLACEGKGGVFGPKVLYIPNKEYKDELADTVKAAVTGNGALSPHDVVLLCILKASKNLNKYFSKYEGETLKARINELKEDPQNRQLNDMITYVEDEDTMLAMIVGMIIFG